MTLAVTSAACDVALLTSTGADQVAPPSPETICQMAPTGLAPGALAPKTVCSEPPANARPARPGVQPDSAWTSDPSFPAGPIVRVARPSGALESGAVVWVAGLGRWPPRWRAALNE
ncbi:MAG: hypothetical protein ACRDMJ_17090 [Solirubrobacteraceae bacterium]